MSKRPTEDLVAVQLESLTPAPHGPIRISTAPAARIYRSRGGWMDYVPQARELAKAKKEFPWLAEVPGHCIQQTLMDLDRAALCGPLFVRDGRALPQSAPLRISHSTAARPTVAVTGEG